MDSLEELIRSMHKMEKDWTLLPFVEMLQFIGRKYRMEELDVRKLIWNYGKEKDAFNKQQRHFDALFTSDQKTILEERDRFLRMLTEIKGNESIPMHIRRWIAYFTEPGHEADIKKWLSKEYHFRDAQEMLECMIAWKHGTMTPELREEIRSKQETRSRYNAHMNGTDMNRRSEADGLPLFA